MALQNDQSQHQEFRDDDPTDDDLISGLMAAADRALASRNRDIALMLIDEIFRVIDGLK